MAYLSNLSNSDLLKIIGACVNYFLSHRFDFGSTRLLVCQGVYNNSYHILLSRLSAPDVYT